MLEKLEEIAECSWYFELIVLNNCSSAESLSSSTVDTSIEHKPLCKPRRKNTLIRCLSCADANPHQAGDAYNSLAMINDL